MNIVSQRSVTPQPDDTNFLVVPLFEVLDAIGFGEHEDFQHFNIGTLFWSLARLFGDYERVMSAVHLPRDERLFLEADIENYIIRLRIVLNDIAFVTRQLLPKHTRGLKGPSGSTHPKNQEMSILSLVEFLEKQNEIYPELAAVFTKATPWMTRLKKDRDNVVHYKSKVVVFGTESPSFAFIDAAKTMRTESTPEGGQRLLLESVADFVNSQMLSLHNFMHTDLANAVRIHASSFNLKSVQVSGNHRISCIGIQRFRIINSIGS